MNQKHIIFVLTMILLFSCFQKNKKQGGEIEPDDDLISLKKTNQPKIPQAEPMDTLIITDNEFMIEATYAVLDYYVVNRDFKVDTLSLKLKQNHTVKEQTDTILSLGLNRKDTLFYYLAQKRILTDGFIYSDKIFFSDSIIVGKTFNEVKSKLDKLKDKPYANNVKIYDFEGFGFINLNFKDSVLNSFRYKSIYID